MEVKGTAVMAIRDYVKLNYDDKFDNWIANLPSETKKTFSDFIDSSKWYPIQNGAIDPTLKLSDMFFNGDFKKGAWESGRFSAQKGLTGIYKLYVKASTPVHIINRASRVFAAYYQPCKMEVISKGDKTVNVHVSEMGNCHDVIIYRIAGWCQKALEISGTKNTEIKIIKESANGQPVFRLDMSWD